MSLLTEAALDLFFPRKCVGCGSIGTWTCEKCVPPNELIEENGVWSIFTLESRVVRELLHYLKYNGVFEAANTLTSMIKPDSVLTNLLHGAVLVPVPTSKSRLKIRGYNQAELITRAIGDRFGCQVVDVLTRRITKTLVGSGKEERKRLVSGSFDLQPSCNSISDPVVIVDDVVTTGSTLSECWVALENAGFAVRGCLAMARKELK